MRTLLPILLSSLIGCASIQEKSRQVTSSLSGDLVTVLHVRASDVIAVAKDTCDDLRLVMISTALPDEEDPSTRITARNDQDQRVTISVAAQGASGARVTVGTGLFGDGLLRQRVMDVIRARLEAANLDDDTARADADE